MNSLNSTELSLESKVYLGVFSPPSISFFPLFFFSLYFTAKQRMKSN